MKHAGIVGVALAAIVESLAARGQQSVTLNVVTAGDQNMVDYVKDYLGPMFEKDHPGVSVKAVGTGPSDAGSQKIYEKLDAEKSNPAWDIDVAVIHQKAAGEMVGKGLLSRYVAEIPTGKLASSEAAKNALGTDVGGYVMPMFNARRLWPTTRGWSATRRQLMTRRKSGSRQTGKSSTTTASRAACREWPLSSVGSTRTRPTPTV